MAQPGELLDELVFANALECREPGDLCIGDAHLPRPAAAGGAALTFVEDRHGGAGNWTVALDPACDALAVDDPW